MISKAAKVFASTAYLAAAFLIISGCGVAGSDANPRSTQHRIASGVRFIGSVDTMKLSKDRADALSVGEIDHVVDLLTSSMNVTHVTVDAPFDRPSVIGEWAARIHAAGKRVWFRLTSTTCDQPHGDLGDGYPSYRQGYLTQLHRLMLAHPQYFRSGDILDGDPEAENSCWWAQHYGCSVQSACRPCESSAGNIPCAPIQQFNDFLLKMTRQENIDLAALRIADVATNVHSTDPGTATSILTPGLVRSMHNLITVDAYPDQNTTDPAVAADEWSHELASWRSRWLHRGIKVSILIGEWGYSNAFNVDDETQRAVIQAEVAHAFSAVPYLVGTNYWVGPGTAEDGGYTQILQPDAAGKWQFRPAASIIAGFYATMNR